MRLNGPPEPAINIVSYVPLSGGVRRFGIVAYHSMPGGVVFLGNSRRQSAACRGGPGRGPSSPCHVAACWPGADGGGSSGVSRRAALSRCPGIVGEWRRRPARGRDADGALLVVMPHRDTAAWVMWACARSIRRTGPARRLLVLQPRAPVADSTRERGGLILAA